MSEDKIIDEAAQRCEIRESSTPLFDVFVASIKPPTREEMDRILRPFPQNPATYEALEKPLVGE